jgi:hypothetical protein
MATQTLKAGVERAVEWIFVEQSSDIMCFKLLRSVSPYTCEEDIEAWWRRSAILREGGGGHQQHDDNDGKHDTTYGCNSAYKRGCSGNTTGNTASCRAGKSCGRPGQTVIVRWSYPAQRIMRHAPLAQMIATKGKASFLQKRSKKPLSALQHQNDRDSVHSNG